MTSGASNDMSECMANMSMSLMHLQNIRDVSLSEVRQATISVIIIEAADTPTEKSVGWSNRWRQIIPHSTLR